jgi:hypothetical protein
MPKLLPFLTLIAAILSGCAQQQQQRDIADAEAVFSAQALECRVQYPDENGVRHGVDRENCTASARRAVFDAKRLPADLTSVLMANRAEIAAEYDAGQLTLQQANLKLSTVTTQLEQARQDRQRANAMAAAAILGAMPIYQQPQTIYVRPCTIYSQIARVC